MRVFLFIVAGLGYLVGAFTIIERQDTRGADVVEPLLGFLIATVALVGGLLLKAIETTHASQMKADADLRRLIDSRLTPRIDDGA